MAGLLESRNPPKDLHSDVHPCSYGPILKM